MKIFLHCTESVLYWNCQQIADTAPREQGLEQKMDRNFFSVEAIESTKKAFLGKSYTTTDFVVKYRGVEINRFKTLEAAEACVDEGAAIRPDAQWAYEEALRNLGYDIPADMANHPNRGPKGPSSNPSPEAIRAAREAAGISQSAAAALIHSTLRTWQDQEAGKARMHPASWELFCIATGKISADAPVSRYKELKKKCKPAKE